MLWILLAVVALPLLASACAVVGQDRTHWSRARWDSAGIAPDPTSTTEPVVQIYAARTYGWRGIFGVHTWIAYKPEDANGYTRYDVVGWSARRGGQAITMNRGAPDGYWAGSEPKLLRDLRGPEAAAAIAKIEAAIRDYPLPRDYTLWPGPNSNTFTAHIARQVPELRLELPPTAVGKDYIPNGILAAAPSGTGYQASLFGLLGVMLAIEEGIEINLLGLTFGIDIVHPAIKLPGIGRIGVPDRTDDRAVGTRVADQSSAATAAASRMPSARQ
ncbi:MAG: DUF3750 domain-containing protein [Alphaproteobacteria bacterium]|nr:DUF3750 domain-containing protein [Alphaproteobacteria bacterium]